MTLLAGKRLLVTGVLTRESIAYAVAERAHALGAELVFTTFGRTRRLTTRAARRLGYDGELIEFDALDPAAADRLAAQLGEDRLDGAVHAIAFAPPGAIGGSFVDVPAADVEAAFRASAYSLNALARATAPAFRRTGGGAIVGLGFDASVTWPAYDWMGVAKAALEAISRYLARDLGPAGVRVNIVSAGPVRTVASGAFAGFGALADAWETWAPLGWTSRDPAPVADAVCCLLSDLTRGVTGTLLHVDGGVHLLGGGLAAAPPEMP
ncbi:MAG: enoyl-ACP reductase FabI [Conexibacter sp.]